MIVKFIEDKNYDAKVIWEMLGGDDPVDVFKRAKSMGIDEVTAKKIMDSEKFKEVEELIISLVEERYKKLNGLIAKKIIGYQKTWDKINDEYSNEIEKITGHKWKFKTYRVVVSPFHKGVSNFGGNKVVRSVFEDVADQKRITAHEILMTQLWNIFFQLFEESKNDKFLHFWGLNEITTSAILGLEPTVNKLWTNKTKGYDQYLKNYSQLSELKMVLKEKYLTKNSFEEYLKEAVYLTVTK